MSDVAKRPMGADLARAYIERMKDGIRNIEATSEDLRTMALELREREGWRDLGYKSWRECIATEFPASERYLYRVLQAALIEREITGESIGELSMSTKNWPIGQKPKGHIPEGQLRPLAQLDTPEERREAWAEANETAPNGRVTGKIVQEAVDRKLGKTRVNGVLAEDPPEIAKARASGKIGADVVVDVRETEPEAAPASQFEEEEPTDEEWLASLPLSSKLTGVSLKNFQADALLYRTLEPFRSTFKHHATRAITVAAKRARNGAYRFRVKMFLHINDPSRWVLCTTPENGGCSGAGTMMLGDCPKCHGLGYWIL